MEKNKKTPLSTEFWIVFISICIVLGIVLMIAFAKYSNRETVVIEKEVKAADIVVDYKSDTKLLSLTEVKPTPNVEGVGASDDKFFEFTVDIKKKDSKQIDYEISVMKDSSSTINDSDIRIYLEKEVNGTYKEAFSPGYYEGLKKATPIGSKAGSMVIYSDSINSSTSGKYRIRLWLASNSSATSGTYAVDLNVNAKAR